MPEEIKLFECLMHQNESTRITKLTCIARIKKNGKKRGQGFHIIDPDNFKCNKCPKGKKIIKGMMKEGAK